MLVKKNSLLAPQKKKQLIIGSWQTILLCTVGELAGGGSKFVAVGVSDMWQETGDRLNMTKYHKDVHKYILVLKIDSVIESQCPFVCLSVCGGHCKTPTSIGWKTSGQRAYC